MAWSLLIQQAMVVDGSGAPRWTGDVAVAGGRIAAVGPALKGQSARTVNGAGRVLAPGFIDLHAHGDFIALAVPLAESKALDGVTTEILGNCGASAFPLSEAAREHYRRELAPYALRIDWSDLAGYRRALAAKPAAVNRGFLVGHGTLREFVMGQGDRAPTGSERRALAAALERALDEGALGLSTGLCYPPGCYAGGDEVSALARIVAGAGRLYATHLRDEGDQLQAALEEALQVVRETGVKLQLSHLKVRGERNWGRIDWLLDRLETVRRNGVDLAADRYPYTAAATSLSSLLPAGLLAGGREEAVARLGTGAGRREALAALGESGRDWARVMIARVQDRSLAPEAEGVTVADLALNRKREPAAALLELLLADGLASDGIFFDMSEANLAAVLSRPWVCVGSDAAARSRRGPSAVGFAHPRAFGSFSRFLGRLVREDRLLELEEGVRRLTSLPASRVGLADRGTIAVGQAADLVLFDPEKIRDRATYWQPFRYSTGIDLVLVNGETVAARGELTGARPGKLL